MCIRDSLQVDGALIIGDGYGINFAEVSLDLREEHIAPDRALAALAAKVFQLSLIHI